MENITDYKYKKAKQKVECIKSFHIHLTVYVIVISFLTFINYMTTDYFWVIFPALGWGVGLIGHWLHVYGTDYFLGSNWEKRKIQQFMDKEEF
ncbi:histidine kinase [Muricauda sp. JGD-17]|uniref:Histidine kinase n=1 Tax=Flagellimonas ochracea TaxID=2696472 RepID=A0A964TA58_9FLAO|nr:2TM domain-containing protein [Allomuricauda ochracea]NAY90554.1 histidine kinase [Allomuricauda ochracea]